MPFFIAAGAGAAAQGLGATASQDAAHKAVRSALAPALASQDGYLADNQGAFTGALNNFTNYKTNNDANVANRQNVINQNNEQPMVTPFIGDSSLGGNVANSMAIGKQNATAAARLAAITDTNMQDQTGINNADTAIGITNKNSANNERANIFNMGVARRNSANTPEGIMGSFSSALGGILSGAAEKGLNPKQN